MADKSKGGFKPPRKDQDKEKNAAGLGGDKSKRARVNEGMAIKKKPIQFMRKEDGVEVIKYHAHWGWITKLKYIEDL